jgi:hypothetical protein
VHHYGHGYTRLRPPRAAPGRHRDTRSPGAKAFFVLLCFIVSW